MDIENITDELKFSLEHIVSEEDLLDAITGRLAELRQSFPSHRSRFTPSHIDFLKSLAPISDRLRSFIELREELADVATVEDYAAMVSRLTGIKDALAPFAVCKRVRKEIRELNEKLPAIREQDGAKRQARVNMRIIDLEQDSPHCRRDHAMVIREGPRGYFWGCSQYPFCQQATQLTAEQKLRLNC